MKLFSAKSLLVTLISTLGLVQFSIANERVVATVDGVPIMESQLRQVLGKKANTATNRKIALEKVIDDFIMQRAIQESGLKIDYGQIDSLVENVAAQNGLTYGQMLDVLDYQGLTVEQYGLQLAQEMLMAEVRNISIGKSIKVEPEEVQKLAKDMMSKAKDKGKLKTTTGTEYRISHILLKTNPILTDTKAKAKLADIAKSIKDGKTTFEAAAKSYSEDYLSGADGGDLGFSFLEAYDPAFAAVASKMKKEVISTPFKSQFGWHILKVTDTRKGDKTEEAYFKKAYETIVNKQIREAEKDWVKALKNRADIQYINQ